MIEEINQQRRRFISAAAMTIAAARLGLVGSEQVQADETRPPAQPAIRPETNTSFAALKDHAPTPTISRKIDPSSTAKSVRASRAMLQKTVRRQFANTNNTLYVVFASCPLIVQLLVSDSLISIKP
jgi:hypothetical protein